VAAEPASAQIVGGGMENKFLGPMELRGSVRPGRGGFHNKRI